MAREMTLSRAVKAVEHSAKLEMQKFAFEANMYQRYKIDDPTFVNAYNRREELRQAIRLLKGLMV